MDQVEERFFVLDPKMSGAGDFLICMGIASGESVEDAYERALDAAYAEADLHWSEVPLGQALGLDWDDEFDDDGPDEHARAAIESASAYGLVARLQGVPSSESRRSRTIADALNLLRAVNRLTSWVAARQAYLVAEVFDHIHGSDHIHGQSGTDHAELSAGGSHPNLSFTLAAQEIAPLLRVPGRTAHRMLGEALRLTGELPGTWEALEAGSISPAQAQVIVEESGSIPAEAVTRFEETVLETAGELTRPKLARRCRRVREELHPESITARKARAQRDRDVSVQPEQDGMAWLGAYLPAEQAHGIFNRVDAAARSLQCPEEPRTLSQLRADVFADVLTHTCTGDPKQGTGFRGIGASVFVTVPVMTLLGHQRTDWQNLHLSGTGGSSGFGGCGGSRGSDSHGGCSGGRGSGADQGSGDGSAAERGSGGRLAGVAEAAGAGVVPDVAGCESGLLDGYGPIDPDTARNLAAHAPSFTRILVHPETGAVLSVGRDRYRPPKHLQDWVRITHPTCIHPGCNRSSWSCEIDHLTPWAHGGQTALDNLGPRCKLHHMLKTEGIWPAGKDTNGTPHSTSLGGKTYTTLPEPPPPF